MKHFIFALVLVSAIMISIPSIGLAGEKELWTGEPQWILNESSVYGAVNYDGYTYDYFHKMDFDEDVVGAGIVDFITLGCTVCNSDYQDWNNRIIFYEHDLPDFYLDFGGIIKATWVVTMASVEDEGITGGKLVPPGSPKFLVSSDSAPVAEFVFDWTGLNWATQGANVPLKFGTIFDTELFAYDATLYVDYIPGETDPKVPEPATMALMGLGLLGAGAFKLRRKN